MIGAGVAFSAPVDVRTAKEIGQRFVREYFGFDRAFGELDLAYTSSTERGEACYYVFNVGNEGFVVVAGSDAARPVLAYSYEGIYDPDNIAPAMQFWLDRYSDEISYAIAKGAKANAEIEQQWATLRSDRGGERGCSEPAGFLLGTKWSQSPYYNNLCPSGCPTGCVATAMAQIMKYWNHPTQGTSSHSYYCHGIGTLSANFGNTTYDWDNMPAQLSGSSTSAEVNAVATLMYHCGVSVNMGYEADGSGAMSQDVPSAISTYFSYTSSASLKNPTTSLLIEQLSRGWPLYYAAASPYSDGTHARHAFVCDGYDEDNLLFHFNLGWGGSGDGFYAYNSITASGYNFSDELRVIINFVPSNVYNNTAKAPTSLSVTPSANNGLPVTLSWTNPSQTIGGSSLGSIQMVVERNGEVVYTQNNATAGQSMTWTDNVPYYSLHSYKVYAVKNGTKGVPVEDEKKIGPTNQWKFMMLANQSGGYKDGYVAVYDASGTEYARVTTTSSQSETKTVELPLGNLKFVWNEPSTNIEQMSLVIRNPQNEVMYNNNAGSSSAIPSVFLKVNNANSISPASPVVSNVSATANGYDVTLTWDAVANPGYGYNVYDNDKLIALVPNATTYSFTLPTCDNGGHCYFVKTLTEAGESEESNMSCVLADMGDGCCPAIDFNYELTASSKVKLYWTRPACDNFTGNKCGYYIYKKVGNGEWTLLTMKNVNATTHTDNSVQIMENVYHYKIVAIYNVGRDDECHSIPANVENSNVKYVLDVDYIDGTSESGNGAIGIYPNPANDKLNVNGSGIKSVAVYNVVGQEVYYDENANDTRVIDLGNMPSGIYMVKVSTGSDEIVRRVSVMH